MKNPELNLILIIILFLLMLLSGIMLSRQGSPYKPAMVTLHKLFAIGFIVFSVLWYIPQYRADWNHSLVLTLMIITGVSMIAAIATGAFLTSGNSIRGSFILFHKLLSLLVTGGSLFLVVRKLI
jgi:CHASE2 domain-containing sensor protein